MPIFECALVYPGMVLLEGTNLSEGRGTTLPFLTFGAPYIKLKLLRDFLSETFEEKKWGIRFKPIAFEPTFDKWKGKRCLGFQIYIIKPAKFRPVEFALKLIKFVKEEHSELKYLSIPYEFENRRKPIEILLGNRALLNWLNSEREEPLEELLNAGIGSYKKEIEALLLYSEECSKK